MVSETLGTVGFRLLGTGGAGSGYAEGELLLSHAGAEREAQLKGAQNEMGMTPAELAEDPTLMRSLRLGDVEGDAEEVGSNFKKSRG